MGQNKHNNDLKVTKKKSLAGLQVLQSSDYLASLLHLIICSIRDRTSICAEHHKGVKKTRLSQEKAVWPVSWKLHCLSLSAAAALFQEAEAAPQRWFYVTGVYWMHRTC